MYYVYGFLLGLLRFIDYLRGAKGLWVIVSVWLMIYGHANLYNPDYPYLHLVLAILAGLAMPTFRCCDHE